MRTETFCHWRIPTDNRPDKTHVTRWKMTRTDALARWPTATEAGGHEVRQIPETEAERIERQRAMHFDPGRPSWMRDPAIVTATASSTAAA